MVSWDFLLDEAAVASVLPDEYAPFRRPIQEGLAVFLEGLPAAHQAAVLAQQAALPPTATTSERVAALARSCPVLHKLGQILARDQRLSPELRRHLQELESLPPSVPLEIIHGILAQEFGPLDRLGVKLVPRALAEASVAVVVPFWYERAARAEGPRHGVFKVLKPGIEERLEKELELFGRVGSYLDQRCDDFGIPHLDYRDSFERVRDKLRQEVRLDREQQHLVQARALYEGDPRVHVPALFEPCTPRVTAMERVTGRKVTDHRLDSRAERRRLARLVLEALIARPFFRKAGQALFHGDPHAGNLFLTTAGRLAILDWSLVGSLDERERAALVQVLLGALTLHTGRMVQTLVDLADQRVDRPALEAVVDAWLGQVRQGRFPGFAWLMGLLDEAFQAALLRVGSDLLLFRKTLHTLEGVVADIGAEAGQVEEVLVGEFLRQLVVEWPRRWLTPPDSRAFSTRLSNADVAQLMLSLPWTATQLWLEQWRARPYP